MPLKESYVIWNNKGGVGKTTLTFHLATQYAETHKATSEAPENVLVIDLCPQANVSMALLSSTTQYGSAHLSTLHNAERTVSHYLQKTTERGPVIDAKMFLTRVSDYNKYVPDNLFLLCGDMNLELVGRHLDYLRVGYDHNSWVVHTSSIRNFIEGSERLVYGASRGDEEWVVFIDTNPAFSVYTEIALAAARKLIIPINSDDFSVESVRAMLDLVYGICPEEAQEQQHEKFEVYRQYMFQHKATRYNLRLPKIHLMVNNRVTVYATRACEVFGAMGDENPHVLFKAYQRHQADKQCFSARETQISKEENFKEQYSFDLQDFHSTAILTLHTGCPLSRLKEIKGKIEITEKYKAKLEKASLPTYRKSLESLVTKL